MLRQIITFKMFCIFAINKFVDSLVIENLNLNNKTLILLTSEFPNGLGEIFIENEYSFLKKAFGKIIIITNNSEINNQRIISDTKTEILFLSYHLTLTNKLKALKGVFFKQFWNEINIIKDKYKIQLTFSILKILLSSIQKKTVVANFIECLIRDKNLDPKLTTVYSYWLNDMALGVAEVKIRMPEINAFSRAHGWDVYMDRHPSKYLPLRSFLINNLDMCFAVSENGKHYLQSIVNVNSDKIMLLRLGTLNSTSFIGFSNKVFYNNTFTIVSCSNIIPLKRIHLIIEALSLIKYVNVKWFHFGDGVEAASISKMACDKLYALINIEYEFKGRVNNNDLMDFYSSNKINLFINVSEYEGIPVSIMEAMSFGIPCLATDVGGNSEIVNDKNGILLNSNPDANEVTQAVLKFIKMDKIMYSEYCQNTYNYWQNNYNAANNYKAFTDQILGER
jgi:glycosyltransferase involved in cell wall biosynthesis